MERYFSRRSRGFYEDLSIKFTVICLRQAAKKQGKEGKETN